MHKPFFHKKTIAGVEHRQDPLLGSWSRINPQRAKRPKQTGEDTPGEDLLRLIRNSAHTCPFCPSRRNEVIPALPRDLFPLGKLQRGQCLLFPNKNPFGEYHAVGILADAHFIPMEEYSEKILYDCLCLSQEYLQIIFKKECRARYPVFVWNFLPPSAGSIIHPHIQLLLEDRPTPIIERLASSCRQWQVHYQEDFWSRLIQEESQKDERLIWHQEELVVLASFAPRGFSEVLILLPGSASLGELNDKQKKLFCWALKKMLEAYHGLGVGSFNLVTYSSPINEDPSDFPFHAKFISRPYPSGIYTNDTGFFERMYDLWIIDTIPEKIAAQVGPFFPSDHQACH